MVTAEYANAITGPVDEAVEVLRIATEKSYFDADDLIARLMVARTRAQRAATAVHLAEQFVRLACAAGVDPGLAIVGNDLMKACRAARGIQSVRDHYEAMAR